MHIPKIFEQKGIDELQEMMLAHPFATLVTLGLEGVRADHIPLYLEKLTDENAVLKGHIGKGNPLWKEVSDNSEALAIFHGPENYISPNYYPSKQLDGKVVPTWNYIAVHVKGNISFIHDQEWKIDMLNALTKQHEKNQAVPWSVADAPSDYTNKLLGGIVGLEVEVVSIKGQWKVSQNKYENDKQGVIKGLSEIGADEMVGWLKRIPKVNLSQRMK